MMHERASSSHIQYQTLRVIFAARHVPLQRLMSMQAQACTQLALYACVRAVPA